MGLILTPAYWGVQWRNLRNCWEEWLGASCYQDEACRPPRCVCSCTMVVSCLRSSAWWWRQPWSCCWSLWNTRSPMHLSWFRPSLPWTRKGVSDPCPLCHPSESVWCKKIATFCFHVQSRIKKEQNSLCVDFWHQETDVSECTCIKIRWRREQWKKSTLDPGRTGQTPACLYAPSSAPTTEHTEPACSPLFPYCWGHFGSFLSSPPSHLLYWLSPHSVPWTFLASSSTSLSRYPLPPWNATHLSVIGGFF